MHHAFIKFARSHALKTDKGVVYGALNGYNVSLREGRGWIQLTVDTLFQLPAQRSSFGDALSKARIVPTYRMKEYSPADNHYDFIFWDTPDTMRHIQLFLDWLFPLMSQYGAAGADTCIRCGKAMSEQGKWVQIGERTMHMHEDCIRSSTERLRSFEALSRNDQNGSYLRGFFGALLCGLLGTAVWIGLMYAGFVGSALGGVIGSIVWLGIVYAQVIAGLIGFLIGFLAEKGYTAARGKTGKGKLAVLIAVSFLCVTAGTLGGWLVCLSTELKLSLSSNTSPWAFLVFLARLSPDLLLELVLEYVGGLLFAGLGVYFILRKRKLAAKGTVIKHLK